MTEVIAVKTRGPKNTAGKPTILTNDEELTKDKSGSGFGPATSPWKKPAHKNPGGKGEDRQHRLSGGKGTDSAGSTREKGKR